MNIQTLKGFRDFLPDQARKRQYVQNVLRETFEDFDFQLLETPALEYEEVLTGKYGEEGEQLMYKFTDNGGRKVALRYDQTVPLARVVAQYQNELPMPFKRYQIQPVWRAENTQKGRFREFIQCDADIVGTSSLRADAQVILVAATGLRRLGFKNFRVLVNDRKVFEGYTKEEIIIIDKLSKIGRDEVISQISQSSKISLDEADQKLTSLERSEPTQNIQEIFEILKIYQVEPINYQFVPTLARGLDYYTGMIFEIEIDGYPVGSVAGGGRYDNLIGVFAGQQIPAVGFAYGFDRIIEAIDELQIPLPIKPQSQILVTIFNKELAIESLKVAQALTEKGIKAELYLGDDETKLDKQLRYADKKGIPNVAIIGPDEAEKGLVTLKNFVQNSQVTLSLDEAIAKLSS